MENFIFLVVFVALGVVFRRLDAFPKQTAQVLNMFALYVSLPALIFLKVPQITFSQEMLVPAIIPWIMLLLSAVLVILVGKKLQWSRETIFVLLLVVPIGNTSFMGLPMVKAFFGESGFPYLIIYDQIGTMLIFALFGSIVLGMHRAEGKPKISRIAKQAVLFPPTFALLAGLALRSWTYPDTLVNLLGMLSGMLTPLVMTAVGFQLRLRLTPGVARPLGFGLAIKLAVAPLLALVGCHVCGLGGYAAEISIFEAGMPPMVTAGAVAIAADLQPELAAALVSLGMALSFGTLPLLYHVI